MSGENFSIYFFPAAVKYVDPVKAKVIYEKTLKYKSKSLEAIVDNVKRLPKAAGKLSIHTGAHSFSSDMGPSPGGRTNGPSFQQSPMPIAQGLKSKTLKSPTPIMPSAGHKRAAEPENGEYTMLFCFTF